MTNYSQMSKARLRVVSQELGWEGSSRYYASKEELASFCETGRLPPLRITEQDGNELTISRTNFTITELLELIEKLTPNLPNKSGDIISGKKSPDKSNKREGAGRGRPKVNMPEDTSPLIAAIDEAYKHGRPFRMTGAHGVYERRTELPPPFCAIGRNKLRELVACLVNEGHLKLVRGNLSHANFPGK